MSDFFSGFWGFYVAIATLISIAACGALLYFTGRARVKTAKSTGNSGTGTAGIATTGHVWDEDLSEYNNPLPRWWMWLFYLTIAFGLIYLTLYPGLGETPGVLGWSSAGAYASERDDADGKVKPLYAKYLAMDIKDVAANAQAHAMGERLFLNYCAQCHGSDAGGGKGFPSLRDKDWLYGGDPQTILASITDGRNGVMPPFGTVLGKEGVKDVASYVRSLSGLPTDNLRAQLGKTAFMQTCAACHGADGRGNPQVGAPNLTDGIWLYGGTNAAIIETISNGRGAAGAVTRMPAHKDLMDEGKIRLLAAYVWGLSNLDPGAAR